LKNKAKEVVRMKRIFVWAISLVTVVCLGSANPVYGAGEPVAEIKSVEGPKNIVPCSRSGCNVKTYTIIPVLVKNNTSERLKGVRVVLCGYDKQKEKIFESDNISYWRSDAEAGRWRSSDSSIKEKSVVRQNCRLPDSQYLYSKEFKEKYGEPKYFVAELFVESKLIDVMASPKHFFKHSNKSEREERLREWEGAK